jgi:hypothetical protein
MMNFETKKTTRKFCFCFRCKPSSSSTHTHTHVRTHGQGGSYGKNKDGTRARWCCCCCFPGAVPRASSSSRQPCGSRVWQQQQTNTKHRFWSVACVLLMCAHTTYDFTGDDDDDDDDDDDAGCVCYDLLSYQCRALEFQKEQQQQQLQQPTTTKKNKRIEGVHI